MKTAIQQRARELGFDACRFTTATPPASAPQFKQWLAAQQHGEMAYLQHNAHKRIDPQQVLANAKSLITLATSYAEGGRESSTPHSALRIRASSPATPASPITMTCSANG